MKEILSDIKRWRARGDAKLAVATVVATRGSAPRPVGSKLAISEHGELAGSVSGGCVENEVYEEARAVLGGAPPKLLSYGISDEQAWSVGLPCGGEIDVFVEAPDWGHLEELLGLIEADEHAMVTTSLGTGEKTLFRGEQGRTGVEGEVFNEAYGPPPRLLIFGAVDTAEALCKAAKQLGWRTVVADARAKFATAERIPSADELLIEWPDQVLAQVEPDASTAVVVLTHENRFDIPALIGALRSEAFYVGALGARRNQERRRESLLEEGLSEEEIDRIAGPTGLDIGAESPAETAVSILGEILAVRAGRDGGRLKASKSRIHAESR
jgi:xanthine dehydrogenase accessory factor